MPPPSPHPAAVPYRRTFLRRHVADELARNDDVLAVSRLARNWRDRFPDPDGQARLAAVLNLYDFFYRSTIDDRGRRVPLPNPDTRLYFPLPVRPVGNPSRRDADLTALLRRLHGADPRGVVLVTGSGAGKTVAARKAFLDCFLPPLEPPDLVGPPRPPPLAGFLPCWLRLNVDTPLLRPQREEYGRREDDDAEDYRQKRREKARAPIVEQLLLAAAGLPFTAPIESWLAHGPPLLLFADLNAADAFTRSVVGMALADFQRKYAGRCRCVVAYRTTQPDDETVRSDQFTAYDLDPIDRQQALAYLSYVRDNEVDMARRLDLPPPPPDVTAERAKLAELIDLHADPQGRSLICTPLLMHLMSELRPGQVKAIHSLADLYDQVVSAQFDNDRKAYGQDPARKLPEHVGRVPHGRRTVRLGAEEGLRVAQARLALAMKARGGNTLSEGETRDVLEDPSLGRRSARPWTPADPGFAWHEAPYYTATYSPDVDADIVLEFGMLRRHGNEVRFLHDSLIDYFAAMAVGHAERPSRRPADYVLPDGWPAAATRRLHADPAVWRNTALFLGGMLRPEQLRDAVLPPMLTAEGKPGWPELVRQLLKGRRRLQTTESVLVNMRRRSGEREAAPPAPDDAVLAALAEAMRLRAAPLAGHPDGLFGWCFHFLRDHWGWIFPESERQRGLTATRSFAGMLEQAQRRAARPWLRSQDCWPLAMSPHLELIGHTGGVSVLAALEGGRLASADYNGAVRVWNLADGLLLHNLKRHTAGVRALAALEGSRLASAGLGGTVRVWDVAHGQELYARRGHSSTVNALAGLEGGRLASAGGTIRIWDAAQGRLLHNLDGHRGGVRALAALEGGRLASAGQDSIVRIWDAVQGLPVHALDGRVGTVTVLAALEGGRLASAGSDGVIRVWDVTDGRSLHKLEGHTKEVNALAALEEGRLASADSDGTIRLWDAAEGRPLHNLEGNTDGVNAAQLATQYHGLPPHALKKHHRTMNALAALGAGQLASAGSDGMVCVWDVPSGRLLHALKEHTGPVNALMALGTGRLASGGSDWTVRVWDAARGRLLHNLPGHMYEVNALAALTGGRLASAGRDRTVRVWDVDGGAPPRLLEGAHG